MPRLWVGIDVGKLAHHVAAVDHAGRCILSRRVSNDEADIALAIHEVKALGRPVCWTVHVPTSMAFLLLAMLRQHGFEVSYVAGIVGHRMRAAFAGEHKTDARDAQVLAHTARMRPDLPVLEPVDELLIELNLLISRRAQMNAGRTNAIMKLRNLLTGISPPLERVLDVRSKGPLTILGFWQTPAAIRAAGPGALELLLRQARVARAAKLAETIVATANRQLIEVPGQTSLATMAGEVAADILVANRRLVTLGRRSPHAGPGIR